MRAFAVRGFGEAPAIHDLPVPDADGAFLIRVTCAGINPVDYKLLDQLSATSPYPFVLGFDFAGVVERVPNGVPELHSGDRVFGVARKSGSYTEYTAVVPGIKAEPLARIPDGVTDEQAAALPIAGITALGSLDRLGVTAGKSLVVMGATGAVGGYAVQMAHSRGVHVIATVRGDFDEARRLGADEVYDSTAVDVFDAIHASHPDCVDAVLDIVNGADAIRRDVEFLKSGASLISTLYTADVAWFADHQITAENIASSTNAFSSPEGLSEIAHMVLNETITARIRTTVELDGAGHMLEQLRTGGVRGKAVIHI